VTWRESASRPGHGRLVRGRPEAVLVYSTGRDPGSLPIVTQECVFEHSLGHGKDSPFVDLLGCLTWANVQV
jgi:hypothetical protein